MYAAVLLPDFELQCALRGEFDSGLTPAALIEAVGSSVPTVHQINLAAGTEGVMPGMSLPQAQARCASIRFFRRDESQEAVATTALHQAAERASPYLESTRPGCCTLDLRRHGELDHAAWATDLVAELRVLYLDAQIGIAPTPDAAFQAAQLARPVLMTHDALGTLARLPLPVLDPSKRLLDTLCDWGIHHVGDLRALDRQQVAERLGTEGLELWERASGGSPRPLCLIRAEATYEEQAEFEGGVETLEPILFRLRRSLEQLVRRLRADYLLAGAVELVLDLDDRATLARTVQIPAPTCDLDTLFRILGTYLDTIKTNSPVVAFRLRALPSTPRNHQTHLWEGSLRDPNGFSETLAKLSGFVGEGRVGTPWRLPTHRPDRCRLDAPDFEAQRASNPNAEFRFPPVGLSLRRYRPPFRVAVQESAGHRPVWLHGREIDAPVRACVGPWRLDGDWWEEKGEWRWEEWDVELTVGGLYRLANHQEKNWWMLGLYD